MSLKIIEVKSKKELKEFIHFPYQLYAQSSQWVSPLLRDEYASFDHTKNPALKHSDHLLLMAYRGSTPVGRVAGIINRHENEIQGLKRARFGWYDMLDETDVSEALFHWLKNWAREKGMKRIEGPMGFTNLDKAGLLIEGFDELPTVATLYNYPYYKEHLDHLGFEKAADYLEYEFQVPDQIPERVIKFSNLIAEKYQLKLVTETDKKVLLDRYGHKLFELINQTHALLYGFVPFDQDQIRYYTSKFLHLVNPEFLALVVDKNDNLAAYAVTMPSYSQAFRKAKGKLWPFGFIHLLRASRKVSRIDMMLIGVERQYKNKGVVAMVFRKLIESYIKSSIRKVESNPELEENHEVRAMWKNYEYRQHKRRRSFIKEL